MNNTTEDSKSPIEVLEEAAAALQREAKPLAGADIQAVKQLVERVSLLKEIADSLETISKGLGWLDQPLGWIAHPLERTAAALQKLPIADLVKPEILSGTANALDTTSRAVREDLMVCGWDRQAALEDALKDSLEAMGRRHITSGLGYIAGTLQQAAEALRKDEPNDLWAAARELTKVATAIDKAMKSEDKPSA